MDFGRSRKDSTEVKKVPSLYAVRTFPAEAVQGWRCYDANDFHYQQGLVIPFHYERFKSQYFRSQRLGRLPPAKFKRETQRGRKPHLSLTNQKLGRELLS